MAPPASPTSVVSAGAPWGHRFISGAPALDFINTVRDTGKTRVESTIGSWGDYLAWRIEFVDAHRLGWTDMPSPVDMGPRGTPLRRIRALRESAYAAFGELAAGREPAPMPLAALGKAIAGATRRGELASDEHGLSWMACDDARHRDVDRLALLLQSLLHDPLFGRLRECGRCTWLFLDTGKGGGRRWCEMRTCGNRAKAEAFRRRGSSAP